MNSVFKRTLLSMLMCSASATYGAEPKQDVVVLASNNLASNSLESNNFDSYNLSLAELGQVQISIATGNSTSLDKAPATASVIYAADIEAMGARNLDDVLETIPGLHVSLSSLSRLDSVYSVRGIHTGFNPQVLLLMNGIPVENTVTGGRPVLFRLPVTGIERIEVIRGPGSAIYGADAYAGVVNVITKNANAITSTQFGLRTGAFNSRDFWLETATEWNGVGIAFSSSYQESDGDKTRRVNADFQSALDTALGTQASHAPGALSTRYQVVDSHLSLSTEQVQAHLWSWLLVDAGVGAGGAQALDPEGRDDNHAFMGDVTYNFSKGSPAWDNSIQLSYFEYGLKSQFNLLPAGTVIPIGGDGNVNFAAPAGIVSFPQGLIGNPEGNSRNVQFDFISLYTGFESQRIRINVGAKNQSMQASESKNFGPGILDSLPLPSIVNGSLTNVTNTPYVFLADSSRQVRYLSVQDEWKITPDINLTAGVRYDKYSDFGGTTNPRIALVWAANKKLTTKLLLGRAFRAPSFSELYQKNNPVSLGRPDLQPERIQSQEVSFNYLATETLQTTLTLFNYQAKNMIDFVDDVSTSLEASKYADNIRDQDGEGFEWEVNWKPASQFYLSANYSKQNARDRKLRTAIPDAPGQQFKANLNWLFAPEWSLNSQLNWIANRERAQGDIRPAIADYTLVNVTLHRKNVVRDLDLSLAVRNATNSDAREPSSSTIPDDYPMEGRSLWLGLSYSIQ